MSGLFWRCYRRPAWYQSLWKGNQTTVCSNLDHSWSVSVPSRTGLTARSSHRRCKLKTGRGNGNTLCHTFLCLIRVSWLGWGVGGGGAGGGVECTYAHMFEQVSSAHSSTRASQNPRSHSAALALHPLTLPLIPFSALGLNFPSHSSCTYNLAHAFSFLKPIHPLFLCALGFSPLAPMWKMRHHPKTTAARVQVS